MIPRLNLIAKLLSLRALVIFFFILIGNFCFGQGIDEVLSQGQIKGNFQIETQYYREDSIIGAQEVPEEILTNGFINLIYTNGNFSAGLRYESYLNPLLGYPSDYQGSGIPYRFASYTKDKLSVTVGNFYEQFGNGLILRTYEERGLGYDNAFDGIRIKYRPIEGVDFTGLIGRQRLFFELGEGIVRAADINVHLNDVVPKLKDSKSIISIGGSAVSKYQQDRNSQFILPENVASFAGRVNFNRKGVNVNAEYAYKYNDPSADNGFTYKPGEAIFVQTTYSKKGIGVSLAAKRVDNMSFRSDRDEGQQNLFVNFLPALTKQHTYNLLATLYPYATQPNGEMAYQADLVYKFKKGTRLGGKYGTGLQINYSFANNLDTTTRINDFDRQGYRSSFLDLGEAYFKDFNIQINKKFSPKWKGIFTYANWTYNQDVIEGKPGAPTIYADVFIADITHKINRKNALRFEAQALLTDQDLGDWATLLVEYTVSPHWFFAALDQYNVVDASKFLEFSSKEGQVHYYNFSFGHINKGNRFTVSYGRQRAGIFCVGGVCRTVPASTGLYLSITSSF